MTSPRTAEWNYDAKKDVLSWSKELSEVADLGQADGLGLEQFRNHVHSDDRKRFTESFQDAMLEGSVLDVEYRLIDALGHEHWVIQLGLPCKGQNGDNGTLRGVLKDISDLKAAERDASISKARIALVEGEVLEAKENLREFTYRASHDLHAPLRSVIGFSELIMDDYSDKIDARGKDHLGRVISQAKHLEEMLDDLLRLSRVLSHPVNLQKVDMSHLASVIAIRNKQARPDQPIEVTIQEGLSCAADQELMENAIGCLLDNSFKFTSNNRNAKIEFGMESVDGEEQFYVRDNGVGFDMEYMDRLFKPFSRLHSSKEFTGNGIGLAIVAAIVKKHGGRIWVESAVDRGTTFYFVLGSPPPA
jgi:signal transduction histidine kinase